MYANYTRFLHTGKWRTSFRTSSNSLTWRNNHVTLYTLESIWFVMLLETNRYIIHNIMNSFLIPTFLLKTISNPSFSLCIIKLHLLFRFPFRVFFSASLSILLFLSFFLLSSFVLSGRDQGLASECEHELYLDFQHIFWLVQQQLPHRMRTKFSELLTRRCEEGKENLIFSSPAHTHTWSGKAYWDFLGWMLYS